MKQISAFLLSRTPPKPTCHAASLRAPVLLKPLLTSFTNVNPPDTAAPFNRGNKCRAETLGHLPPKAPRCKHGEYSHSVTHFCCLLFRMQRLLYCPTCCRCSLTEPTHGAAGSGRARAAVRRGEPAEPLKARHSQAQPGTLPCAPHSHEGAHACYSTAERPTAKPPSPPGTATEVQSSFLQLQLHPATVRASTAISAGRSHGSNRNRPRKNNYRM